MVTPPSPSGGDLPTYPESSLPCKTASSRNTSPSSTDQENLRECFEKADAGLGALSNAVSEHRAMIGELVDELLLTNDRSPKTDGNPSGPPEKAEAGSIVCSRVRQSELMSTAHGYDRCDHIREEVERCSTSDFNKAVGKSHDWHFSSAKEIQPHQHLLRRLEFNPGPSPLPYDVSYVLVILLHELVTLISDSPSTDTSIHTGPLKPSQLGLSCAVSESLVATHRACTQLVAYLRAHDRLKYDRSRLVYCVTKQVALGFIWIGSGRDYADDGPQEL